MKRRELVYFKRLQRLATMAVFLTTLLLIYLFLSSFISGAVSGSDTQKVMGMLVSIFGQDAKGEEPSSVTASVEKSKTVYRYDGDTAKINVNFLPSGAKTYPVSYESSDLSVASVDNDGIVTYHALGTAKITVTASAENALSCSFNVYSQGANPLDGSANVSLKELNPAVGGTSAFVVNGGATSAQTAKYTSLNDDVVTVIDSVAYFLKEGTATLRATFENETYRDFQVNVRKNDSMVYLTDFTVEENTTFLSGKRIDAKSLISAYKPDNAIKRFIVTSDNSDVVKVEGQNLVMKDRGTANVTFTSVFDKNFSKSVQVTVEKTMPTSFEITASDTVNINGTIKLTVKHSPVDYPDDAVWTVVNGFGEITDGNKLKAVFFGKITVRCQSTLNPDLTAEKVISVKLYSDFYSFVRKILGHFSLFALLGLGVWGSLFLLTNPKYSVVLAPGVCFILAALCEMFQACTPGRYFTIGDVFINFFGTLTGITIGIIVVTLFCVIMRLVSKSSFKKLKEAYSWTTIYTVFGKLKSKSQKPAAAKNLTLEHTAANAETACTENILTDTSEVETSKEEDKTNTTFTEE